MGCVESISGMKYVYIDDLKDDNTLNTAKQYAKNGYVVLVLRKHYDFDSNEYIIDYTDGPIRARIINKKTGEIAPVYCDKPGIYEVSQCFHNLGEH